MKIYEIGTGYTPIPAKLGAATEIVAEALTKGLLALGADAQLVDIRSEEAYSHELPAARVWVPGCFSGTDVKLGLMHKLKRVVYSVSLAMTLGRLLRNSREPVILHFHNQYNLFFFLKLVGKKTRKKAQAAYTVHSYIWANEWETIRETVRKRYFQEIYCVRKADWVMVLNDMTAEHFEKHLGIDPKRIHKVRNGVDPKHYHPLSAEQIRDVKDSAGLDGKTVLLQVGSVCPRKNQLGVLKLLRGFLQEHPDAVYVYAGGIIDGAYQTAILDYARENGIIDQVRYAGELCPGETLNSYYNMAAVTLFPSKSESFGLVILESLAAGTPVIGAAVPPFPLADGYHVYHTREELEGILEERIQAGKKGLGPEAVKDYLWERIAGEHLGLWEKEPERRNGEWQES